MNPIAIVVVVVIVSLFNALERRKQSHGSIETVFARVRVASARGRGRRRSPRGPVVYGCGGGPPRLFENWITWAKEKEEIQICGWVCERERGDSRCVPSSKPSREREREVKSNF